MTLSRRLTAEFLGSALLTAAVFGSVAMGTGLTGDAALGLLATSLVAGAVLGVLIAILGPVSGAHLNPAVTLAFWLRHEITLPDAVFYVLIQIAGAVTGAVLAHAMFDLPLLQVSGILREAPSLWLSELVATFGLILTILGAVAARGPVPALVGTYVVAGFWFTASTGFSNPAVTIARSLTPTGAGLRPENLGPYLAAQFAGALLAALLGRWLFAYEKPPA